MLRTRSLLLVASTVILFTFSNIPSASSLAQEWMFRVKPQGTLKVVDLFMPSVSVLSNYAEGLVMLDKDKNLVPCLAEDFRWLDDRRIEFKLDPRVTFHNGERFNAEALKVNWEEYRKMDRPRPHRFLVLPDETIFQIVDDYRVRFTLPDPDVMALVKFQWFLQFAPSFFSKHKFDEGNWGYLPEAGSWGTGPFRFVEGTTRYGKPSRHLVLEAYEDYWDPRFPKVQRVIFENELTSDRKEAVKLCRENERMIHIVSHIRPLDTLQVAESPFGKVVKSKDVAFLVGTFNERKWKSKWRDIRLRKAVNHAINREELKTYAAKGNAYNLGGFIPAGAHGHNPGLRIYDYDTERARSLLAEGGYAEGFGLKMITYHAWKLEAQIIATMLERIGLKVTLEFHEMSQIWNKIHIGSLKKPPEEEDWDIVIWYFGDWYGHTAASFLSLPFIENGDMRWTEYDPIYEGMWKEMTRTVDPDTEATKTKEMINHVYNRANWIFIYSPITLYAVEKEVDFVPQKNYLLRLKETSVTDGHWSVRGKNN